MISQIQNIALIILLLSLCPLILAALWRTSRFANLAQIYGAKAMSCAFLILAITSLVSFVASWKVVDLLCFLCFGYYACKVFKLAR
jgi:hypothetical protein